MRYEDRIIALVERLVAGNDLSDAEWRALKRSKLFDNPKTCEALVMLVAGEVWLAAKKEIERN